VGFEVLGSMELVQGPKFEVPIAKLLKIEVFWKVMACFLANCYFPWPVATMVKVPK
jgi:hypothetical protein